MQNKLSRIGAQSEKDRCKGVEMRKLNTQKHFLDRSFSPYTLNQSSVFHFGQTLPKFRFGGCRLHVKT